MSETINPTLQSKEAADRHDFIDGLVNLAVFYRNNPDIPLPSPDSAGRYTFGLYPLAMDKGWALAKAIEYDASFCSDTGFHGQHNHWLKHFGPIALDIIVIEKVPAQSTVISPLVEPTGDHDSPAATAALS